MTRLKETFAEITQVINLAQRDDVQDPEGVILNDLLEAVDADSIDKATDSDTYTFILLTGIFLLILTG